MLTRISPALAVANCVDDPFGVVRRPDADPLAAFEAEREQARRQTRPPAAAVRALVPADLLVAHDQRVALAEALDVRSKCAPIVSPISGVAQAPWT